MIIVRFHREGPFGGNYTVGEFDSMTQWLEYIERFPLEAFDGLTMVISRNGKTVPYIDRRAR